MLSKRRDLRATSHLKLSISASQQSHLKPPNQPLRQQRVALARNQPPPIDSEVPRHALTHDRPHARIVTATHSRDCREAVWCDRSVGMCQSGCVRRLESKRAFVRLQSQPVRVPVSQLDNAPWMLVCLQLSSLCSVLLFLYGQDGGGAASLRAAHRSTDRCVRVEPSIKESAQRAALALSYRVERARDEAASVSTKCGCS